MTPVSEHHKGEESRSKYIRTYRAQKVLSALLIFSISIAFVACTTGSAPPQATRQSTPTHTPSGPPSGTLLYQSNWSHGLAGWHASPGWRVIHGMLQSDLSSNNNLTVPYLSSVPNYTLEIHFQIVSVPRNGGYFVITADRTPDKDGYTAGILNLLSPAPHNEFVNPQIQVYLNPMNAMDSQMEVSDYEPRSLWHAYDVEVNGSTVHLLIDGLGKSFASSTQTNLLSNGPFHVVSSGAVVRVSSVSVSVL
jgi:hypothetical protein